MKRCLYLYLSFTWMVYFVTIIAIVKESSIFLVNRVFFIFILAFNKKLDIGKSSLLVNPIISPDDYNDKNRIERILKFVENNKI